MLDNSDSEVLLFHGSLGEHVAKVRDRAPKVKLWVQVDDGAPHQDFAENYEDLIAAHEPDAAHRALGRRPLLPLHRWHNRNAQGRDVAPGRPLGRARRRRLHPRRFARADIARRSRHDREELGRARRPRAHSCVAAHARHRCVHDVPSVVHRRRDRHARRPPLRPARVVADGATRTRHANGDRRRRVRQADARARSKKPPRRASPTTSRRSA